MLSPKQSFLALAFAFAAVTYQAQPALAEESVTAEVKEAGRDLKKNTKQLGRDIKDETCEMVNGKAECTAKKAKHGIKNATDEVKDKTNLD